MSRADRRSAKRRQRAVPVAKTDRASSLLVVGLVVIGLKLALVPLAFDPSADVPFVLPRTLLSHALSYVLVAVLAGLLVMRGTSFVVRSWVHVPVLAFLGISAVATTLAVNSTLALFGTHVRMLGLTTIADGVVTYFAVVHLVRRRRDAITVLVCILVASAVVLSYEAVQLLSKDPFSWAGIDTSLRPISTIGQPTTLGQYLCLLSIGTLALAALTGSLHRLLRAGLAAYAGVLLFAAGLTGTRAAALGVVAAAGFFVLVMWTKHPSRRARLLSLVSGLCAAALLAGLVMLTPLGARLLTTVERPSDTEGAVGQFEPSTVTRIAIYDIAARMVAARPLVGYGPDTFAAALPSFRPEAAPPEVRQSIATSPHSWIAAIATSSGLLGLAAFVVVICAATFVLFRSPYNSLAVGAAVVAVAYLASGAVTINALETDTLFWSAIAAIVGANASEARPRGQVEMSSTDPRRSASASTLRRWIPWTLVAAAIVMAATALPALEASHLAKRSASLRAPATAAAAIDLATRAIRMDPNRAEYWQQLALAYVAGARWADASGAFQSAARLAPYDIRFLTDDIQVQLVLANSGDAKPLERAAQLADQAVKVDPNNPSGHLNRAIVEFRRGDLASATQSVDRALRLDPNSTNNQLYVAAAQIYVAATQADIAAGGFADAIIKARRGLAQLGTTARSVPLRLELARALFRSGRSQEALAELDAALLIAPGDQSLLALKQEIQKSP